MCGDELPHGVVEIPSSYHATDFTKLRFVELRIVAVEFFYETLGHIVADYGFFPATALLCPHIERYEQRLGNDVVEFVLFCHTVLCNKKLYCHIKTVSGGQKQTLLTKRSKKRAHIYFMSSLHLLISSFPL